MKRELKIFFTAVMFYTRIPCPEWVDHSEAYINLSTRYFPLIGWIVAGISLIVFQVCQYFFPIEVSTILLVVAGIITTGAFHEDGFADVCDGFGGGWTKEKILSIMKDSRIGTYGVAGLILILLLKVYSLSELASIDLTLFAWIIIAAHALSRLCSVFVIYTSNYVRDDDRTAKAKPLAQGISTLSFLIAIVWGVIPFIVLLSFSIKFIIILLPLAGITHYLRKYFMKWIGGYTGDCLGATQQVNEITFYLTSLAVCNYI